MIKLSIKVIAFLGVLLGGFLYITFPDNPDAKKAGLVYGFGSLAVLLYTFKKK